MIDIFGNIIGIIGMICILTSYFGLQSGKFNSLDIRFLSFNTIGGISLLISLCINFNLASFILEIVYITISLYGFYKYYNLKNEQKNN